MLPYTALKVSQPLLMETRSLVQSRRWFWSRQRDHSSGRHAFRSVLDCPWTLGGLACQSCLSSNIPTCGWGCMYCTERRSNNSYNRESEETKCLVLYIICLICSGIAIRYVQTKAGNRYLKLCKQANDSQKRSSGTQKGNHKK